MYTAIFHVGALRLLMIVLVGERLLLSNGVAAADSSAEALRQPKKTQNFLKTGTNMYDIHIMLYPPVSFKLDFPEAPLNTLDKKEPDVKKEEDLKTEMRSLSPQVEKNTVPDDIDNKKLSIRYFTLRKGNGVNVLMPLNIGGNLFV